MGVISSKKYILSTGRFSCFRNTLEIMFFKNFKFYENVVIVNFTMDDLLFIIVIIIGPHSKIYFLSNYDWTLKSYFM